MVASHSVFQLVYMSLAVRAFSVPELDELLRTARKRNAELAVTGMLLYEGGAFIQALEGTEADVVALYQAITQDPRHRAATVLWSGHIAARSFGEWTMGFVSADGSKLRDADGYRDFFANGGTQASSWTNPTRATELLRDFRDLPWRQLMEQARVAGP